MADYGSFCPVSMGAGVIADRWTPLIVRELLMGASRFNDIARGLPGISRSLLTQRLRFLEAKGVVERWPAPGGRGHEYRLTDAGTDLQDAIFAMGAWSLRWLYRDFRPSEIDPVTLLWWMRHSVDRDRLPTARVVVEFELRDPDDRLWMVLDRREVSLCRLFPGGEVDVVVKAATPALGDVFHGVTTWQDATDVGLVEVLGPPRVARALPGWLGASSWAPMVSEIVRRRGRPEEVVGRAP